MWLVSRSDNLQVFVVAEAFWSSHAGLSESFMAKQCEKGMENQLYACGKIFRMPRSLRLPELDQNS